MKVKIATANKLHIVKSLEVLLLEVNKNNGTGKYFQNISVVGKY